MASLDSGEHLGQLSHTRALEFWTTLNPIERQRYLSVPVSELLQRAKDLDKRRQAVVKQQVDSLVAQRESAGMEPPARSSFARSVPAASACPASGVLFSE